MSDSLGEKMSNKLERLILQRVKAVKVGAITEKERLEFFDMVTEMASRPLRRHLQRRLD